MKSEMKFDFSELKGFQKKLEKLEKQSREQLCMETVKELAARMLRKVKGNTPVGKYPAGSGKTGGTLRRGWTVGEVIKTRKYL